MIRIAITPAAYAAWERSAPLGVVADDRTRTPSSRIDRLGGRGCADRGGAGGGRTLLAKEFEAAELVNRIIRLLDGPDQRRAQQLAREALADG